MTYTAAQIYEMASHIRQCEECSGSGNDADIVADTYAEDLPPEELEGYIQSTHSEEWRAFLDRNRTPS